MTDRDSRSRGLLFAPRVIFAQHSTSAVATHLPHEKNTTKLSSTEMPRRAENIATFLLLNENTSSESRMVNESEGSAVNTGCNSTKQKKCTKGNRKNT